MGNFQELGQLIERTSEELEAVCDDEAAAPPFLSACADVERNKMSMSHAVLIWYCLC